MWISHGRYCYREEFVCNNNRRFVCLFGGKLWESQIVEAIGEIYERLQFRYLFKDYIFILNVRLVGNVPVMTYI